MKITLLAVALTLCSPLAFAQSESGVAVLDIDRAAKELGVEAHVKAELAKMSESLEADLAAKQEALKSQHDGMLKMVGEDPTPEQRMQLINGQRQLESEFSNTRREALEKLSERKRELVSEFQDQLKPLAQAEAEANGFDVVILKKTTFSYSPSVDVTEGTMKRARDAGLDKEVADEKEE